VARLSFEPDAYPLIDREIKIAFGLIALGTAILILCLVFQAREEAQTPCVVVHGTLNGQTQVVPR
jgi:hypothetical protein